MREQFVVLKGVINRYCRKQKQTKKVEKRRRPIKTSTVKVRKRSLGSRQSPELNS